MAIHYLAQNCNFSFKGHKQATTRWIQAAIKEEGASAGEISVVFCSAKYLLELNRKYLNHDYDTDIITFDDTEGEGTDRIISGDLTISIDMVRKNADYYGVTFETELKRVIIHGVLHLLGYDDHTENEQKEMRSKEDYYLNKLKER